MGLGRWGDGGLTDGKRRAGTDRYSRAAAIDPYAAEYRAAPESQRLGQRAAWMACRWRDG